MRYVMAALAVVGAACGGQVDEAALDPEVSQSQAELYQAPGITKWTGGLVPVCFTGMPPGAEVAWTKDALAKSWASVANVGFIYSNTCPFPGRPAHVQLTFNPITDSWGSRGVASFGSGTPAGTTVAVCAPTNLNGCLPGQVRAADYEESYRSGLVHEFGHLLGFLHEQQRPDSTATCPLATGDQSATVSNGVFLTPTYDADSIMNYCRGWDGATSLPYQLGYHGAETLSTGDVQGVRVAYGARRIVASSSFNGSTAAVNAVDGFGGAVPGAGVFYNGAQLAVLGQSFSLPATNTSVCVTVPGTCEFGFCTKPHKECDPTVGLEVRAPFFTTTKVNIIP